MKRVYPIVMYLEGNPDFKVIFTNPTTGIVVEVDDDFKDIYFIGETRTTFNNIEQPGSNFIPAHATPFWYSEILKQQRKDFKESVCAINALLGDYNV